MQHQTVSSPLLQNILVPTQQVVDKNQAVKTEENSQMTRGHDKATQTTTETAQITEAYDYKYEYKDGAQHNFECPANSNIKTESHGSLTDHRKIRFH